ncbi:MAG: immunoglobulin domain-containing protein, partial [Bacteroidetes bacterium]|nr:immunoglobulin domain-containing protein [Bacteroidota bacterium]
MAENLNSTHYTDGTPLVNGTGTGDITGDYTTKYYFWYNDDSASYAETYGALYTWAAMMNGEASSDNNPSGIQGVCPDDWHVPGDTEWKELEMYLGMSQVHADSTDWRGTDEGGKLKEAGTTHWGSPNTGATNSSGFTALPGGLRGYQNISTDDYFWSSSEFNSYSVWIRELVHNRSDVNRNTSHSKDLGLSVRCIKYTLHTDSLALVALYDSTDGANWTNNTNWLTGNVSTWYGITVSGDRVTEIDLNSNNLVGTIPPEIGNLTNLTHLNFADNQLSGTIPVEIGNLTGLISLELRNNTISGSIPAEISNLINLGVLWLQCNQLSGAVPVEIWNLSNIGNLQLFHNQLSGTIPPEIGTMSNLVFLNLQNNHFTGLANLSPLGSLAELTIENNRFTFKDIEPNIGVPGTTFTYSPQDSVGELIDTTVYVGTSYTMSVSTGGANSKYQWKKNGVPIGSISSDSTYTINSIAFSDSGTYICEITNTVATDLILYSRPIHVKATIISSFPYSEDFESGSGSWRTGGSNSSWQLGNPAGPTINSATSGSTVWVTNLTGNYNPDEVSYIISPRFNLSGLNYPKIEFNIWWDAEGFYDGANFQYKEAAGEWKTLG